MSDDVLDYVPALRVFARSLCKNEIDADDLVQETLLRAIENAASYTPGTKLRAWLFTIMRNRFYTSCMKRAREQTGGAECVSSQPAVAAAQDWHMAGLELKRAVDSLPDAYRSALVLVVVIGESYKDAAQVLDCDIGTIKSRINRARRMVRDKLGEPVT
jgi:RNA polymerase sigma-70 factor (ECF subfamily)